MTNLTRDQSFEEDAVDGHVTDGSSEAPLQAQWFAELPASAIHPRVLACAEDLYEDVCAEWGIHPPIRYVVKIPGEDLEASFTAAGMFVAAMWRLNIERLDDNLKQAVSERIYPPDAVCFANVIQHWTSQQARPGEPHEECVLLDVGVVARYLGMSHYILIAPDIKEKRGWTDTEMARSGAVPFVYAVEDDWATAPQAD